SGFRADAPFFHAMAQDPLLSRVKLVAEPWDIGPGGYQLGGFPIGWQEWNDRYRDSIRAFWIHQDESRGALATRLAGSSDAFGHGGRRPVASVNLVTAHDGFTLHDLVSFENKHNEANGEANRDGHAHNLSANCGIEGPTDDPVIVARRAGLKRALLSTLMFSRGVPLLLAGDELGRTQQGNNNAYCQDNRITWIDWAGADQDLAAFVARLARLRRQFAQLRGTEWLTGRAGDDGERDIVWLQRTGDEMHADQWVNRERFVFAMLLAGPVQADLRRGAAVLVIFNAGDEPTEFRLPPGVWREHLDSALPVDRQRETDHREQLAVAARCVMMLSQQPPE
ncbi:MAG: glycogen debranching enzyme GlgX, partial [Burkholderiaceae bacterium]